MPRKTVLPSPRALKCRAKIARARMEQLFNRKNLKHLLDYRVIGFARLDEKLAMALFLAEYMKQRKIRSVEELAGLLYIGTDYFEVLEWMRSPVAFSQSGVQKRDDDYLLALCGIERDPGTKSFVFSGNSA